MPFGNGHDDASEELVPSKADLRSCPCETCKKDRHEPHKIGFGLIHDYSEEPEGGWQGRYAPRERRMHTTLFGVELETDVNSQSYDLQEPEEQDEPDYPAEPEPPTDYYWRSADGRQYGDLSSTEQREAMNAYDEAYADFEQMCADIDNEARYRRSQTVSTGYLNAREATTLAEPSDDFWIAKHDGSVSGPEFASQPASMAYWNSIRSQLTNMFNGLLHGGLRSHQYDQCGMHINISTTTFRGSYGHLYRFCTLLTDNQSWAMSMSQRSPSSARQWARFDNDAFGTPRARSRWARNLAQNGFVHQERYGVLNGGNEYRVEFRLPRGTLNISRFFKNLQWTDAMIEYTRSSAAEHPLTAVAFMEWASGKPEYGDFNAYVIERQMIAQFTRPDAVSPGEPEEIPEHVMTVDDMAEQRRQFVRGVPRTVWGYYDPESSSWETMNARQIGQWEAIRRDRDRILRERVRDQEIATRRPQRDILPESGPTWVEPATGIERETQHIGRWYIRYEPYRGWDYATTAQARQLSEMWFAEQYPEEVAAVTESVSEAAGITPTGIDLPRARSVVGSYPFQRFLVNEEPAVIDTSITEADPEPPEWPGGVMPDWLFNSLMRTGLTSPSFTTLATTAIDFAAEASAPAEER